MLNNILLALSALRANKMRSLLTMLGIIIGIASVIAIVTVGNSLTASVNETMSDFGVNTLTISLDEKTEEEGNQNIFTANSMSDEDYITPAIVEEFETLFNQELTAVSINESVQGLTTNDSSSVYSLSTTGINTGYQLSTNFELAYGRSFSDEDINEAKNLVIIEEDLATAMFGNTDPIGQGIKLYSNTTIETFYIIGVSTSSESGMMSMFSSEETYQVYIPITTGKNISDANEGYTSITALFNEDVNLDEMKIHTQEFFSEVYQRNDTYTATVSDISSMVESFTDMLGTIQIAIAAIAAISLLVGGIGVMNIMLVSITERTKEIGTRKALGAPTFDIMSQFVTEAVVICMIGGALGVAIGVGLGMMASNILGFPATPDGYAIVLAVGFSMAIGLFFGYYPAKKAAKLDPIEALRHE